MKIHIFNDTYYSSQDLQPVANGMYPIYGDGEIIANILSTENSWVIRLANNFRADNAAGDSFALKQYGIYSIQSIRTRHKYNIVITPKYYPKARTCIIPNSVTIGNSLDCDIAYPSNTGKPEALRITMSGAAWIATTNSPNFFTSNGRILNNQQIHYGDYIFFYGLKVIFIGNELIISTPDNLYKVNSSKIVLKEPERPKLPPINEIVEGGDAPLYSEEDYYQKSPRLNYITYQASIKIDEPPAPEVPEKQPWIISVGPRITMGMTSVLSMSMMLYYAFGANRSKVRMYISLGMMVMSLVGSLIWPNVTKAYRNKKIKKREEKRVNKYRQYLKHKEDNLKFICENQRDTLLTNNPSPRECLDIVQNRKLSLWQRNISHYDFLYTRVGLGEVKTNIDLEEPEEKFSIDEEDFLMLEYKKVIKDSLQLEDTPVCYSLVNQQIGAIVGKEDIVKEFMDCIFLQILALYSYSDLKIVVYSKNSDKWDFLKTVPHCWNNEHTRRYFATSIESFSSFSVEIEKLFDARAVNDEAVQEEDDGSGGEKYTSYRDYHPYYLFIIDNIEDLRNNPLIHKILHYKRNLGFSILTTTTTISLLPAETTNFVSVTRDKCVIVWGDSSTKELEFKPDLNHGLVDMNYFASLLANIPVQIEKGKFELPKSLPFLEMYRCGRVEQLNCLARWKNNAPYNSLAVPIGIDQNSELFLMDIHEKAFGPHGLVAGTTGSGKSEWIITYILSLAVNFSPDEVQFVLIDYKGGGLAKSFENAELKIKLPHLAGTITNLDKSEIFRSISAIESELKRRQSIFNDAREKLKQGSMDIYKYQQCYRKGQVPEPMSHLLIVCDEFAELKQQEPEFMEQLISTSRIGRSLGVHLILATQKPTGVVNDQIWSNSKFKVALKVQTKSDSNEILKKPDAAYLKQTGAFYLQVGTDEYFNLGQSAWAGAKYYPSDSTKHEIDQSVQGINEIGQIVETYEDEQDTADQQAAQGEQLINIVQYISEVGKKANTVNRQLWLENIPPFFLYNDLRKKYKIASPGKYNYNILVGEYDEPRKQLQAPLYIDLAGGNIAIIGKGDGSIEKLISMIVWSGIVDHNPAEIAYYILDFGTETMKKFAKFPHVGEVVFQDEIDKVAGVLGIVAEELSKRKELLSEYNGSFEYYNKVSEQKLNLITVVINGYDIFSDTLPKAVQMLNDMFRDCPKYGIVFVLSGNAKNTIPSRTMQFFNHLILMQMADDSDYRAITNCRKGLVPKKTQGRGICKIDASNVDSYCEFQTASIDVEEKEIDTIRKYADRCVDYYKCKVRQLAKIPDDISSKDLFSYITTLSDTPIGIDLYGKQLARYDFLKQKIHLISAGVIEQNINFLYGLVSVLSKTPNTKVRIVDLLGIFKKPMVDVQFFDQDKNMVFAALEKDAETRTDSQDCGITFVIGAGRYKQNLSAAGQEIFRSLMSKIANSKKNIYLLIDSYDSIRTLKLEEWFNEVNPKNGIWLGPGLGQQSIIESKEPSDEDKKFNYPGLAYIVKDGEYIVTKTVLDQDK